MQDRARHEQAVVIAGARSWLSAGVETQCYTLWHGGQSSSWSSDRSQFPNPLADDAAFLSPSQRFTNKHSANMTEAQTPEVDLDNVIDRLLEGESDHRAQWKRKVR